ncbi:MAG: crossover junction endodeoxyribonuclease RuvC [Dehalococcoidia bacterium]
MPAPHQPTRSTAAARRILGVDPGLRTTGWGLLAMTEGRAALTYGVIQPDPAADRPVRLRTILEGLLAAIDAHQPDAVALETPFVGANARSALALGQAQAAAMLAASQRDLPVFEYAPREVKQAVSGDGNAEKSAVAEALRLQLGLEEAPRPLDASDALAVAYCHYLLGQHNVSEVSTP